MGKKNHTTSLELRKWNGEMPKHQWEEEEIAKVFSEKYEDENSNMYPVFSVVTEAKLYLSFKKPICEFCGCIFEKEEHTRACAMSN